MLDQLTSFLFAAGIPRPPEPSPDLRAQALELLDSPGRLRASWAEIMRRLEDEGFEAGELALICRVHLNLLDNCAALLEALAALSDRLRLPPEKWRSAAVEVKSLEDEIRPLYELATRKPPPFDPAKFLAAQRKHAGEPAVEVGEVLRQIQAGEAKL
ncbi:MAG TPA: hypothetical protein VMF69_14515 [Gemmataceae bacterium]|nr:hypothetical protein [Gemmataceae bacterium]